MRKEENINNFKEENVKILKKSQYKEVYVIDNKYILKKSNKERIKAEKIFFDFYKEDIYEKVVSYKEDSEYILYQYIKNRKINLNNCNIKKYIMEILKIIRDYKSVDMEGYGDILAHVNSWSIYLEQEIKRKRKDMMYENRKFEKVKEAIKKIEKFKFEKKLIHGDLGIYNVLFRNNEIIGIIDPRTVIGDAIYDFIYFLFSHISIIKSISIPEIIEILSDESKEKIINLMYIILYDRISIEVRHDMKTRIGEYEKLWKELNIQEKQMKIL